MAINVEHRARSGDPLGQRGDRPRRLGSRASSWPPPIRARPAPRSWKNWPSYKDVYCEWSPNEKVAMEVGIGASMAGGRALVCMKHVGLNVAADPFFSASYIGVEGGLVVVSADDPGMHSSQDEQDNRNYAKFARVPAAGALRQRRGQGLHGRGLRALRALRHPGALPHHHPDLALQEPGRPGRARQRPRRSSSSNRNWTQVRHDARQRHRPARHRGAAGARPRPSTPRTARSTASRWAIPRWASSRSGAAYGYTREALPERQLPEAGHDLSAAQEADRRVPRQGGQALRGRGTRSRSSRKPSSSWASRSTAARS